MRQKLKTLFFLVFLISSEFSFSASAPLCSFLFTNLENFHYPEQIKLLSAHAPHTILDMQSYLKSKLGAEVLKSVADAKTSYQILLGDSSEKSTFLKNKNILLKTEIQNPFGAFNVTMLSLPEGKIKFVFTNVNGESRYLQLLSFLKLAGIAESRISLEGKLSSYRALYLETFQKINHKPDLVVFGFANTAIQAISETGAKTIWQTVHKKNLEYSNKKWIKPSPTKHELSNMGIQILKFKNGKEVWFIDNEYGDRAAQLTKALAQYGVKNILLLGTAGALNSNYKVGDIVSPEFSIKADGQIAQLNTLGLFQKKYGLHSHVDTPSLETKAWLNSELQRQVDFVDVELQKVMQASNGIQIDSYLVISDVLTSQAPTDYTQWSESHRLEIKQSLYPILNMFLQRAGVTNLNELRHYQIVPFIEKSRVTK